MGKASIAKIGGSTELTFAQQKLAEAREITEADFYSAGGKKEVPSAKVYQLWANESGIKAEIVESGENEDKAWATINGWIGSKENPIAQKQAQVVINFKIELEALVLDAISGNHPAKHEMVDGKPVLSEKGEQLKVYKQWVRIKRFAVRTAITKAEAIAHRKLLGVEFRNQAEIDHEISEVASITDGNDQSLSRAKGELADAFWQEKLRLGDVLFYESLLHLADITFLEREMEGIAKFNQAVMAISGFEKKKQAELYNKLKRVGTEANS